MSATLVKERPILMSPPMALAVDKGRKTQTRRVMKEQPAGHIRSVEWHRDSDLDVWSWWDCGAEGLSGPSVLRGPCRYGVPGDRLWVREAFYIDQHDAIGARLPKSMPPNWADSIYYRANGDCCAQIPECQCATVGPPAWRPSIHMPRWASRLTLEIVTIRAQRLHWISEADALAEGVSAIEVVPGVQSARCLFRSLWERINGPGSWDLNPWVWAIEFKRLSTTEAPTS